MKVESLRQRKFKVRCIHKRFYVQKDTNNAVLLSKFDYENNGFKENGFVLDEMGGMTIVEVTPTGDRTFTGVACCSDLDNYNKKKGLQLALDRALAQFTGGYPVFN